MEYHTGGIEREVLIRYYTSIVPAHSFIVIHNKHVIGEILSKAEIIPIGLCL